MLSISEMMFSIFLDVALIRCIASISSRISVLLESADFACDSAFLLVSLRLLTVSATCSVIVDIVAWSCSTAPACSVAPSARSCADCARFSEPAVTCSADSSTCLNVESIFLFILRIDSNNSTNLPTYLSSISVEIAKLPSAIKDISLLRSLIIRLRLAAISFATSFINATSSSLFCSGNGESRSPCENFFNLSARSATGFSIWSAILAPILLEVMMLPPIIASTNIPRTIFITNNTSWRSSPFFTLRFISSFIALYNSSYLGPSTSNSCFWAFSDATGSDVAAIFSMLSLIFQ